MRKLKFKLEICRVKLNPEQAVLQCTCVTNGVGWVFWGEGAIPAGFRKTGGPFYGTGNSPVTILRCGIPSEWPNKGELVPFTLTTDSTSPGEGGMVSTDSATTS